MIFRIGLPRSDDEFGLDSDGGSWDDVAKDPEKKKSCVCICFGIILVQASAFVGKTITP